MIILLSLLVAIIGLLMYALAADGNAKVKEIGRIMFAMGLLAFLLTWTTWIGTVPKTVTIP